MVPVAMIKCVVLVFVLVLFGGLCHTELLHHGLLNKKVIQKQNFGASSFVDIFVRHKRQSPVENMNGDACCDVFPNICDAKGGCVLDIGVCVQLCICATAVNGDWCSKVINLLNGGVSTTAINPSLSSSATSPLSRVTSTPSVASVTSSVSIHATQTISLPTSDIIHIEFSDEFLLPSVHPLVAPPLATTVHLPIHSEQTMTSYVSKDHLAIPQSSVLEPSSTASTYQTDSLLNTFTTTASPILNFISNLLEDVTGNSTSVQSSCSNCTNGICVFDEDHHLRCVKRTDQIPGGNLTCPPGFGCLNGLCTLEEGTVHCECYKNWTGAFCDEPCLLDCGQHGRCVLHETAACACKWNYTGLFCEKYDPQLHVLKGSTKVEISHIPWIVVGVCSGLFVLLLLLLVSYFMYRRQWIPIRKLVYYFQEYEDDDGKEYDAFVSYKSCKLDEQFVLHKLFPKLEKEMDFKLCLHFRDFLPGEPIANSIIQAVENSRRTIMILTPSYINSEWCRLEYQKAQHEMLKLKHKIIPIILEDVSHLKDIDKNLKSILDTVTYIEWPSDENNSSKINKFWKMLELTMPKKKTDSVDSCSSPRTSSESPLTTASSLTLSDTMCDDVFNNNSIGLERSMSVSIETSDEYEPESLDLGNPGVYCQLTGHDNSVTV